MKFEGSETFPWPPASPTHVISLISNITHQSDIYIYTFIYIYLFIYIEEGSGTPLQYSCLENPMDGGAW